jgi:hypothetical protein
MPTREQLLQFLHIHQQKPVFESPYASRESRLRTQTDLMRLGQLPVESIARYIANGAACDTPDRLAANEQLEYEGFVSYRQLLPVMRRLFPGIWD